MLGDVQKVKKALLLPTKAFASYSFLLCYGVSLECRVILHPIVVLRAHLGARLRYTRWGVRCILRIAYVILFFSRPYVLSCQLGSSIYIRARTTHVNVLVSTLGHITTICVH